MINKIKKLIAVNDLAGLRNLSIEANEMAFYQSWNQEIEESGYFLHEYPKHTALIPEGFVEEKQRAGNPIDNDDFFLDIKQVDDLNSGKYNIVSLFEAAIIIGERAAHEAVFFITSPDCPLLFCHAVLRNEIDPRHPVSCIPFSKLPKSKVMKHDLPDMTWEMSLHELVKFAVSKGYDSALFDDLLNPEPETQAAKITDDTKIYSEIYSRLMRAVNDFEAEEKRLKEKNPDRKISLDNNIKPWLKGNNYSKNQQENSIFGRIIAEHYGIKGRN